MFRGYFESRSSISGASESPAETPRPSPRRANTAPSRVLTGQKSTRPDWILVFCYMLVYLELGWLVMLLWRSYGRPIDAIRGSEVSAKRP